MSEDVSNIIANKHESAQISHKVEDFLKIISSSSGRVQECTVGYPTILTGSKRLLILEKSFNSFYMSNCIL